jgi:hypothetical protein
LVPQYGGSAVNPYLSVPRGVSIYYSLYPIYIVTTTIAVKESTRDKLRRIMKAEGAKSLDQTINSIMERSERIPKTMFGVDRPKAIRLSGREHEEFQR